MPVNLLLVSLIFLLAFKTVSFGEIQPKNLYAGNSFEFVQKELLPEFLQLIWTKTDFSGNDSEIIVTYSHMTKDFTPASSYRDRVEFSITTFSLTLKKLQETDSGLYCTTTIGTKTIDICQYNVSVVESHGSPTITFLPWILFTSTLSTILF